MSVTEKEDINILREKQLDAGGKMCLPQGQKRKFKTMCENQMEEYMDYCWEIGIPKTQIPIPKTRFTHELVHFMESYHIQNTFPNTVSGIFCK